MIQGVDKQQKEADQVITGTQIVTECFQQDPMTDKSLDKCLKLFEFSVPLPVKGANTMQLYYNNCNGIEINKAITTFIKTRKDKVKYNYIRDIEAPTKIDNVIQQMKVWSVGISCLSKLGVAWEEISPSQLIQKISKVYDPTSCWTVASSDLSVGNFLKPGGTGIYVMNEYPGRIKERGTDPWHLGCWSYIILGGEKNCPDLLIGTGYRVGKRTGVPGASTAWAQQRALLCKANRDEDPHIAFLSDLDQWISQVKFIGTKILLLLDANEQWTEGSGIYTFASDRGLANINELFNLEPTHLNIIHPSRSTTIDYCLCSTDVLGAITYTTSTPYDLDTLGDHHGIIIDIYIRKLTGQVKHPTNVSRRKLVLSNAHALDKYIGYVQEGFDKQNILKRANRLYKRVRIGHMDIENIMRQYYTLDKEVFCICCKAEQKGRPTIEGRYEWSPTLARGIKQLSYWRN